MDVVTPADALLATARIIVLPLTVTICGCCVCSIAVDRGNALLSTGTAVALIAVGDSKLLGVVCTTTG